jgi:hypothetical protein
MAKANAAKANHAASLAQKPALPAAAADKGRRLEMVQEPGKTRERMLSDVLTQGLATNAITAARFAEREYGAVSLTEMVASLRESGDAINRNDTASAERMLYAQSVALNAMFCELARVSHANMFTNLDAMDRYMRLALKAQSQSRMTVETLAAMKNPPVVFAKQANIANGHQQVNNGATRGERQDGPRAEESQPAPSKLLEAEHVERMDVGAPGTTGRDHSHLEAVGASDRTKKRSW